MPNRDGKGPRKRSPRPSKPKGGLKKGKCKQEVAMPLKSGSNKETISSNISHCMSAWKKNGKVSGKTVSKDKAMKMCAAMSYSSAKKSATGKSLAEKMRKAK